MDNAPNISSEQDELLSILNDDEFEVALAAYNGEGDKDYMRVTRKRIMDAERAYTIIESAETNLSAALHAISSANTGTTRTRALSLAATKIEEAILWLGTVAYGVAPHNMDSTTPFLEIAERMNEELNNQSKPN